MDTSEIKTHPDYDYYKSYWEDCYVLIDQGDSKTIKSKNYQQTYLPKLDSHSRAGYPQGKEEYEDFLFRAVWSDIPSDTVEEVLGKMFSGNSSFKNLPEVFKFYLETITSDGKGLINLEETVSKKQLQYTRVGLMAYIPKAQDAKTMPKVAVYNSLNIINWHQFENSKGQTRYDMVLLKTVVNEMDPETFEYRDVTYYIIHGLIPEGFQNQGKYYKVTIKDSDFEKYGKKYSDRVNHYSYIEPKFKGFNLDYVPFVVVNGNNIDEEINIPCLYEQSILSVSAYNASALYKLKCKLQTWAMLVGSGFNLDNKPDKGQKANGMMLSDDPQAKAEYIQPRADAVEALLKDWENTKQQARDKGIVIANKTEAESGVALEIRGDNQANAYKMLVKWRNAGIVRILSYIADWGSIKIKDPNEMIVPFTDFNISTVSTEDMLRLAELVERGRLPEPDFYQFCKKHNFTSYENFDEFQSNLLTDNFAE